MVTIGVLENDDEISSEGESLLETENAVATVATHVQTRSGREHCSSQSTKSVESTEFTMFGKIRINHISK